MKNMGYFRDIFKAINRWLILTIFKPYRFLEIWLLLEFLFPLFLICGEKEVNNKSLKKPLSQE